MGLQYGWSPLLLFLTLEFSIPITFASQVQLEGKSYITYGIRENTDPRKTKITLRFRTIHPNGLLIFGTEETKVMDYLQLCLHHGQVR